MKKAILKDVPAGKVHDLTALIKDSLGDETDRDSIEGAEISLGRIGGGADIELGLNFSPVLETKAMAISGGDARTISRQHATITYGWKDMGEGFYLKDHSSNGTMVEETKFSLGDCYLQNGDKIFFGSYGPVIYEEIFEELKAA